MPLKLRVRGNSRIDADEVRRALAVLADPQHGIHLHAAPYWAWDSFAGHDLDGIVKWVKDQSATGIYYGVNPVPPGLKQQVANPKNKDALCRRWFFIDVDRNKTLEPDNSATDAEHEKARGLTRRIMDHLTELGWPVPVLVDSGNGFHLLYRVDLPNDPHARALVGAVLKRLMKHFDGEDGGIGKECVDARRIAKLPGTLAQRGAASDERPFRMCKLLYVPDEIEVVTADMLQAAGQKADKAEKPAPEQNGYANGHVKDAGIILRTNDKRAYGDKAIKGEKARIALSVAGKDRNICLNDAGFRIAQLIPGGYVQEQDAFETLATEALLKGLPEAEVRGTLQRAFAAGKENPRHPLEKKPFQKVLEPGTPVKLERITIRASTITPKRIDWLMPSRIPKRFITVFAGRTGLGKSFVVCDIMARITRGGEIPGGCAGEVFEQGSCLFISEDPYEYVLAPRLIELGADMEHIHFMTWEAMAHYSLNDTAMLERAFQEAGGPKMVAIDPPTNFLGEADEHKNAEVRAVLTPIVAWLVERDVACVLITHVNKQTGKGVEAINRVLGSVAWTTTSRIAHSFAPDPDDKGRCLFVPMKSNLGAVPKGLAYRIVNGANDVGRVEWLGEVDTTADEAMSGDKHPPRQVLATEWMVDLFRQKLEWSSDEFWASANQHGISKNAINEARVKLAMPRPRQSITLGGQRTWTWWVPADWPPLVEGHSPEHSPGSVDFGRVGE